MKRSLIGYGTTTKPIAKTGGWDIYDEKFLTCSKDEFGNNLLPCSHFEPEESSLEIVSPGFLPTKEIIL
ncbi:MAG: UDP-N-acetylmuramoyl-L-alanine--D-glutamate ligase, partial [Campylobacteraceae bacterium]|nr:UDP-N-acetylmuramoyl-L-alanine--D-glutamate ligase [Campylobacteraceae bacterium]